MKNITVSIDEQTHRLARIRAAELDTSVSALVRDYLRHLAAEPDAGAKPVPSLAKPSISVGAGCCGKYSRLR